MKKIIVFVLCSLHISLTYAQLGTDETISNISIPSAQSFEITSREGIPIDESSGRVNLNLPLGQLENGNISVPISISYNCNGVRMDEVSSWTGTNFVL